MTTVDNHSHLLSFGELAAMYLYAWNNELWQPAAIKDFDDDHRGVSTNYKTKRPRHRAAGVPPPGRQESAQDRRMRCCAVSPTFHSRHSALTS